MQSTKDHRGREGEETGSWILYNMPYACDVLKYIFVICKQFFRELAMWPSQNIRASSFDVKSD
jgi:hypothetical protein